MLILELSPLARVGILPILGRLAPLVTEPALGGLLEGNAVLCSCDILVVLETSPDLLVIEAVDGLLFSAVPPVSFEAVAALSSLGV